MYKSICKKGTIQFLKSRTSCDHFVLSKAHNLASDLPYPHSPNVDSNSNCTLVRITC